MAVRQVAAVGQVHPHDPIAGLQDGEVDRLVRLGPGVGLDVGVLGAEQLTQPLARQPLHHVDELAAAVVAPSGVALRVLVREDRAGGAQHRFAREVLRGDQLDAGVLSLDLVVDRLGDLGVGSQQLFVGHASLRQ